MGTQGQQQVDSAVTYPMSFEMAPKDWAITQSTTNLGKSQHHWTNQHAGIKHSLMEAIVTLCSKTGRSDCCQNSSILQDWSVNEQSQHNCMS